MRLPFQTFTQRDVPQMAVARPEQFQAGPAPVAPSLAANTQLQQVRATTRLVDSIVGAVNSYNDMNLAFERKAEKDRLKAERELEKATNEQLSAAVREFEPETARLNRLVLRNEMSADDAIAEQNKLYADRLGVDSPAYGKSLDFNRGLQRTWRDTETRRQLSDEDPDKQAAKLVETELPSLEPQLAAIGRRAQLGQISGDQAAAESQALIKRSISHPDAKVTDKAFRLAMAQTSQYRAGLRDLETRQQSIAQETQIDEFENGEEIKLREFFSKTKFSVQTNPDGFDMKSYLKKKDALVDESVTAFEGKLRDMGFSETQIKSRVAKYKTGLLNVGSENDLLYTQTAALAQMGAMETQASLNFKTEFEKLVAERLSEPVDPAKFDGVLTQIISDSEKAVTGNPQITLNSTQMGRFIVDGANHAQSQTAVLRAKNLKAFQDNIVTGIQTDVSLIIDDKDAKGNDLGTYVNNVSPKEDKQAKERIRSAYKRGEKAGIYDDQALIALVSAEIERFDVARVEEWFIREADDVEKAVKELERGKDGAFPSIVSSGKRESLIKEGRRIVESRRAELAAEQRPFQQAAKIAADDHISDVADGNPVVPGALGAILDQSGLSDLTKYQYLQEEEYANWFWSKANDNGGLGSLSKPGLEALKALIEPRQWEEITKQPESDRIFTEKLREKWYKKFVSRIDEVIKARESDPAQYAQDEMDQKNIGKPGVVFDPKRLVEGRKLQTKFDNLTTPVDLPKKTTEELRYYWSATETGEVTNMRIGNSFLLRDQKDGRNANDPAIGRGQLIYGIETSETEADAILVQEEGPYTRGLNLVDQVARKVGEEESILRLYSEFFKNGDDRNLRFFHQAVTLNEAKFAEVNNIDRETLFKAMDGEDQVNKVIGALPDYGDANSNARVKNVLANYALVIKSQNPNVSDSEVVRRAAEDFLEVMGGNFAQGSSFGETGSYVPIPKGASPNDWASALADVTYWTESRRSKIKSAVGTDANVINTQSLIAGAKTIWAWKAVGDGTSYQLYAAGYSTPIIVTQQEVADRVAELERTPAPADAERRLPGRFGITRGTLSPQNLGFTQ